MCVCVRSQNVEKERRKRGRSVMTSSDVVAHDNRTNEPTVDHMGANDEKHLSSSSSIVPPLPQMTELIVSAAPPTSIVLKPSPSEVHEFKKN